MALRVPKIQHKKPKSETLPTDIYIDKIIKKLLGAETLPELQVIRSNDSVREFLIEMSVKSEVLRPKERRESSKIDINTPHVWATKDLTKIRGQGSRLVVEIKVCNSAYRSLSVATYTMDPQLTLINCGSHATVCIVYTKKHNA